MGLRVQLAVGVASAAVHLPEPRAPCDPDSGLPPVEPWLSGTAAHLFVLCVLIAFGWFYRYDGKFPTIRKVGREAECCAICH